MNTKEMFTTRNLIIAGLVLLAACTRLIPHPYNFTPLGAIALFCGCYVLNKKYALLLPMAIMVISDTFIYMSNTNYTPQVTVYLALAIIGTMGYLLRGREQRQTIMVASLTGSMLFFLITNFEVWLLDPDYAKSASGLADCYIKAIPFFRGTIMGDLFYNLVLFGSFALIKWRKPHLTKA